jgi:phosphoglycerate dehydrogenase-like enzyme
MVDVTGSAAGRGGGDADAVDWFGRDRIPLLEPRHRGVRWLQLRDAGAERWLAAGVQAGPRTVTSARGAYGHQVAEHALGLVLACSRRTEPQAGRRKGRA